MFCRNCGKNLSNTAVFCNSCGTTTNLPSKQTPSFSKIGYEPKTYQNREPSYETKPYVPSSPVNYTKSSGNSADESGIIVTSVAIIFLVLFVVFISSLDDSSDTDDSSSSSEYTSSCCDIDLMVEHLDSSYSELSYVIYFDDSQRGSGTLDYGESTWYSLCTNCSGSHTIEVYWGDGDDCYTEVTLSNSDKSYGCTNYS